jgi:hypothetical protein
MIRDQFVTVAPAKPAFNKPSPVKQHVEAAEKAAGGIRANREAFNAYHRRSMAERRAAAKADQQTLVISHVS